MYAILSKLQMVLPKVAGRHNTVIAPGLAIATRRLWYSAMTWPKMLHPTSLHVVMTRMVEP